jgi:hypothetical protein
VVLHPRWWTRNGVEVQGLATVALIAVTAVYVFLTRGIVTAARSQATSAAAQVAATESELTHLKQSFAAEQEVARKAQEHAQAALSVSNRPWLTTVPQIWEQRPSGGRENPGQIYLSRRDEAIHGSVPLRNVGAGIAIIDADQSYVLGPSSLTGQLVRHVRLVSSAPVVPPGGTCILTFEVQVRPGGASGVRFLTGELADNPDNPGTWALDVVYSDMAGGQQVSALAHLSRYNTASLWYISGIDYREGATGADIVSVRMA